MEYSYPYNDETTAEVDKLYEKYTGLFLVEDNPDVETSFFEIEEAGSILILIRSKDGYDFRYRLRQPESEDFLDEDDFNRAIKNNSLTPTEFLISSPYTDEPIDILKLSEEYKIRLQILASEELPRPKKLLRRYWSGTVTEHLYLEYLRDIIIQSSTNLRLS
jgi:hypothetical protein